MTSVMITKRHRLPWSKKARYKTAESLSTILRPVVLSTWRNTQKAGKSSFISLSSVWIRSTHTTLATFSQIATIALIIILRKIRAKKGVLHLCFLAKKRHRCKYFKMKSKRPNTSWWTTTYYPKAAKWVTTASMLCITAQGLNLITKNSSMHLNNACKIKSRKSPKLKPAMSKWIIIPWSSITNKEWSRARMTHFQLAKTSSSWKTSRTNQSDQRTPYSAYQSKETAFKSANINTTTIT